MAAKKKARAARKKSSARTAPATTTRRTTKSNGTGEPRNARSTGADATNGSTRARGPSRANAASRTQPAENVEEPQLRDLFVMELADFIGGEQQVLRLLDLMQNGTTVDGMQQTLDMARDDIEHHVRFATRMLDRLDGEATSEGNATLQGLVNGVEQRVEQMGHSVARDLALITALQKATHIDMASLGTLTAWARELDARDMIDRLEGMLNDKKLADRHLTRVAFGCLERDQSHANGLVGSRR